MTKSYETCEARGQESSTTCLMLHYISVQYCGKVIGKGYGLAAENKLAKWQTCVYWTKPMWSVIADFFI